jgi:hypothetical protein
MDAKGAVWKEENYILEDSSSIKVGCRKMTKGFKKG